MPDCPITNLENMRRHLLHTADAVVQVQSLGCTLHIAINHMIQVLEWCMVCHVNSDGIPSTNLTIPLL